MGGGGGGRREGGGNGKKRVAQQKNRLTGWMLGAGEGKGLFLNTQGLSGIFRLF